VRRARSSGDQRSTTHGTAVRDPEVTRKALLDSSVELFEKYGFAATSVNDIVEHAHRTKGAFYHHFESKDELLREVHDEFIDYELNRARDVLARDISPNEQLRAFIVEALMEPMSLYKAQTSVFLQERRFLSQEIFDEIKAKRDEYEGYLVEIIDRGIKTGTFRSDKPARLIAFAVIGMSSWAHTWLNVEGPMSPAEIGDLFADLIINGLKLN
jgi:AcrR family transcriptional regulator